VVQRFDYPVPDQVEPGLGVEGGMSRRTRVMASLGAVAFIASVIAVGWLAVRTVDRPVFVDGEVIETLVAEPRCRWQLAIPIINTTDDSVVLEEIEIVMNREPHRLLAERAPVAAGGTTVIEASLSARPCPETTDDIDHGSIWITWESPDGTRQTMKHRF